jgi:predicted RNA binding protein YcfA (HicA-like mRNA interferase family)
VVKVRDLLKRLADDGWTVVRQRGSHRQLRHSTKPNTVTVAGHELGRLGGSRTSAAKRRAARANGRKGGRPRKTA